MADETTVAELEFLEVNMCVVCLAEKSMLIAINFDDRALDPVECNIGPVLTKHLWFQGPDELRYKKVCNECWEQVNSFHVFYTAMEQAHFGMMIATDSQDGKSSVKNEPVYELNMVQVEEHQEEDENDPIDEADVDPVDVANDQITDNDDNQLEPEPKEPVEDADEYRTRMDEEDKLIAGHCDLTCGECGKAFEKFSKYRSHCQAEHGIEKPVLICCGKKLCRRFMLLEHVRKFQNPNEYQCSTCGRSFCNKSTMRKHMKQGLCCPEPEEVVPVAEGRVKCSECNKCYANEKILKTHVDRIHRRKLDYSCASCVKSFFSKAALELHRDQVHSPAEEKAQCQDCGSWHKNASALWYHRKRYHVPGKMFESVLESKKVSKKVRCPDCGKVYPNADSLRKHQRFIHQAARIHVCPVCDKTFRQPISLKEHMKRHIQGEYLASTSDSDVKPKRLPPKDSTHNMKNLECKTCGKHFLHRAKLVKHIESMQCAGAPSAEAAQCSDCKSWHKNSNALWYHRKRYHEPGKMYDRTMMMENKPVITGQEVKCPDCDRVAPNMEALRNHRRRVHEMIASHQCQVCQKMFKKALNLKEHMSQHTGEYLYKCEYCDQQFYSNANMFAHRKREHREEWERNHRRFKIKKVADRMKD